MSFHVPPIALVTVHGDPGNPDTWERRRVLFIDEDGEPWIRGNVPWTNRNTHQHHPGHRTLRSAGSFRDYLGIAEGSDENAFMPATPGWRVVEGYGFLDKDSPDVEVIIRDVAAWAISSGQLNPVTTSGDGGVGPCDADDSINGAIILILGPSDPTPDREKLEKTAREHYKIANHLKSAKKATTP